MYIWAFTKTKFVKKVVFILVSVAMIFVVACRKATSVPIINPAVNINSTPQFTAIINGNSYNFVNGSTYASNTTSNTQIRVPGRTRNTAEFTSLISASGAGYPSLSIDKGTVSFPTGSNLPDTATFDAFFSPGTYNYSYSDTNGIQIDWVDPNGNIYNTSMGSQIGSTFNITAKQVGSLYGTYQVKIMATFNCTLYNAAGNSVALTKGTYIGYYLNH
jgi:hypothetical protein